MKKFKYLTLYSQDACIHLNGTRISVDNLAESTLLSRKYFIENLLD